MSTFTYRYTYLMGFYVAPSSRRGFLGADPYLSHKPQLQGGAPPIIRWLTKTTMKYRYI